MSFEVPLGSLMRTGGWLHWEELRLRLPLGVLPGPLSSSSHRAHYTVSICLSIAPLRMNMFLLCQIGRWDRTFLCIAH